MLDSDSIIDVDQKQLEIEFLWVSFLNDRGLAAPITPEKYYLANALIESKLSIHWSMADSAFPKFGRSITTIESLETRHSCFRRNAIGEEIPIVFPRLVESRPTGVVPEARQVEFHPPSTSWRGSTPLLFQGGWLDTCGSPPSRAASVCGDCSTTISVFAVTRSVSPRSAR